MEQDHGLAEMYKGGVREKGKFKLKEIGVKDKGNVSGFDKMDVLSFSLKLHNRLENSKLERVADVRD